MNRCFRLLGNLALASLLCVTSFASLADIDHFHVTDAEKQACTADAVRLCMSAYPSEQKLLVCMKQNRASLTEICRLAFDAGLKRRRL